MTGSLRGPAITDPMQMTVRETWALDGCPCAQPAPGRWTVTPHSDNIYARRGILAVKGDSLATRCASRRPLSGAFRAYTRVKDLGGIGRIHTLVVRGRKIHTPSRRGRPLPATEQNSQNKRRFTERTTTVDFFPVFCLKRPRMPLWKLARKASPKSLTDAILLYLSICCPVLGCPI
jgi:hypothetical protein